MDCKTDRAGISPGTIVMTFRDTVFTWITKLTQSWNKTWHYGNNDFPKKCSLYTDYKTDTAGITSGKNYSLLTLNWMLRFMKRTSSPLVLMLPIRTPLVAKKMLSSTGAVTDGVEVFWMHWPD